MFFCFVQVLVTCLCVVFYAKNYSGSNNTMDNSLRKFMNIFMTNECFDKFFLDFNFTDGMFLILYFN